ncbi:MarR family transcriptional regulator [Hoylesella oralis]|uniref:MarR family winged helix-turn-helix transcriptional regulator n=1 Tax=Hoylesella oralis TaxID=28134 RepID=UPI0028E5A806|nr:MarR family transcriptional regulator [Hoylesella oralis]
MGYEQLKLDNQICFRLYTASRLVTQTYHPYLSKLGITYPQYLVLMVLWDTDNQPVNDIAKRLLLETNTITPLIKRMEQQKLVLRTKGRKDGRQTIISLTKWGKTMEKEAAKIPACMAQTLRSCGISDESLIKIVPELDTLINSIKTIK